MKKTRIKKSRDTVPLTALEGRMGPETSLRYPFTPRYSHLWALVHKTTCASIIYGTATKRSITQRLCHKT
jgi:hypothetical protein